MLGINAGMPGACAGQNKYPEIEYRSLYSLVDAIISGSWTAQKAEEDPSLKANLSRLMTADLSKVSYLGLEYGTNDFNYSRPLGTNRDATCETFKGALNYSLKKLAVAFPRLRLFLITPAWRLNFEELDSDTHTNEIGLFLKEYVDGMLEIAALHHIPCLDMNAWSEHISVPDCPARAVLIEIARGHDGTNNGRLGLSIRRASERCNIAPLTNPCSRYQSKAHI